jgi:hypothetical protein
MELGLHVASITPNVLRMTRHSSYSSAIVARMGSTTATTARAIRALCGGVPASAALLLSMSCSSPPLGPTLRDVIFERVTLESTAGDASLCCCRAVTTVTNQNAVTVDVTLKFSAYSGNDPIPLGTVVHFIDHMAPQAKERVEASGFLFSCARITEVKSEIDVKGLDAPGS